MDVPWKNLALALDELLFDAKYSEGPAATPPKEWDRHKAVLDDAWMDSWGQKVSDGHDRETQEGKQ